MRKTLLGGVVAAAAAALIVGTALPAAAADTTTTFVLNNAAGGLSVSAPASKSLGTGSVGSGVSTGTAFGTTLGNVVVTDTRGALLASWTASVLSTDFTTGAGSAAETIPAGSVTYWSGAAVANTGLIAPVPGQLTALLAVPLSSSEPDRLHSPHRLGQQLRYVEPDPDGDPAGQLGGWYVHRHCHAFGGLVSTLCVICSSHSHW